MQDDGSTSPVRQFLRHKWVRIILVVDILAILVVVGIIVWNTTKTSTINFNITPIDAHIQIDGWGDYSNGLYRIHPGTHTITISHEGLDSKNITVDFEAKDVVTVSAFISSSGDFDFYKLKENFSSYQKLEEIASKEDNITIDHDVTAEEFISNFQKHYSIYEILPIVDQTATGCGLECGVSNEYDILSINDGRPLEECILSLCLYITDTTGKKESVALSIIDEFGYDPDAYQIIYEEAKHE